MYEIAESTVAYSNVAGGYPGLGNIDADPLFVDPDHGNFRLASDSPCIDTGDPAFVPQPGEIDLDRNKRVWDGLASGTAVVDMGAHEFGSHPYADLDCDGLLSFDDINAFLLALTDPLAYATLYPLCDVQLADCNGNGLVNFDDINAFVAVLGTPQHPVNCP